MFVFGAWLPGHFEKNVQTGEWRWVNSQWAKDWTKEHRSDGPHSSTWSLRNKGKGYVALDVAMEPKTIESTLTKPNFDQDKLGEPKLAGSWSWSEGEEFAEYLSSLQAQKPKAAAAPPVNG